jgi:membrane protein implicated in regulation of membrane protease activity
MSVYFELAYWLYLTQFWVIAGIILVLLEVTDGNAIFFLPMGVGSFILAIMLGLIDADFLPVNILPQTWYWLLVLWIVLVLLSFLVISRVKPIILRRLDKADDDINNY